MNRRFIVAANWKMNGNLSLVDNMIDKLSSINIADSVDVVVCPSFPYLGLFSEKAEQRNLNERVFLGAQNASEYEKGAYTGEVSTNMLEEMKVNYVIVGHSERRSIFKETSTHVADKVKQVLSAGLTPILCVGESEAERAAEQTETVLAAQLQPVVDAIGIESFKRVVIAYEPVWAIGTGKTASPEIAQETHGFIRRFLAQLDSEIAEGVSLLYGGSVNGANCSELFAQPDIDGGLIGGASLKVDEFAGICSTYKG